MMQLWRTLSYGYRHVPRSEYLEMCQMVLGKIDQEPSLKPGWIDGIAGQQSMCEPSVMLEEKLLTVGHIALLNNGLSECDTHSCGGGNLRSLWRRYLCQICSQ